jgi:adenosylcobinamide-GDP ribazoletransferase
MTFFKSLLIAFSMFSAIPLPQVEWNEKNMRYMMCAFPLVGLSIAFFQLLFAFFCRQAHLPLPLAALGFTLIPVFVSGGIHVDGFMDTADALASHACRERKLEILKDSHSGSFAVLSCLLYFISFYVFSLVILRSVDFKNFLVLQAVFVISRILSAFAVATFPIARNSGLVHTFSKASQKKFTAACCLFSFALISALVIFFGRFLGTALVAASLSVFCFYFVVAVKNFGGITGDTAGAFVQICELAGLMCYVVKPLS